MGTYGLSAEEIVDDFEEFLQSQEGDISSEIIIEAWNILNKKWGWKDKIKEKNK